MAPVKAHDFSWIEEHLGPDLRRLMEGASLDRATAPLALARIAQELMGAQMGHLDVIMPLKLKKGHRPKPQEDASADHYLVGLVIYLTAPVALKAGLTSDDLEHLIRSVALLMSARGDENEHVPKLAVERLMDSWKRKAAAAPPAGKTENLIDRLAVEWGSD